MLHKSIEKISKRMAGIDIAILSTHTKVVRLPTGR
jgi:ribosomal protein S8